MEVITIDGVEYVKAAQLARQFKYTSDYVGQLCRAGKVDAKLVGRTWYVNPDSLAGHKTTRYAEKTSGDTSSRKVTVAALTPRRQTVEPVLRKETAKALTRSTERSGEQQFLKRIVWQPVKYEHDTSELLPPLRSAPEPVSVPVDIAEASKVRIKNLSQPTELASDSLPEVALTGSLKVKAIDENFDNSEENIDISDIFAPEEVTNSISAEEGSNAVGQRRAPSHNGPQPKTKAPVERKADAKYTYPVAIREEEAPAVPREPLRVTSFAPARVRQEASETKSRYWLEISLLCLLFLSGLVAVLGLTTEVTITGADVVTSYTFDHHFLSHFFSAN